MLHFLSYYSPDKLWNRLLVDLTISSIILLILEINDFENLNIFYDLWYNKLRPYIMIPFHTNWICSLVAIYFFITE